MVNALSDQMADFSLTAEMTKWPLRAEHVAHLELTRLPYNLLHTGDAGEDDLGRVNDGSTCLTWLRTHRTGCGVVH